MDSLTALTPGATFLPSNNSYQNSARVKQVAINGTPPGEIGFSFDGIDNKGHGETNWAGPRSMGPNPEVVSEFSVLTHTFTAEAGSDPVIVHLKTRGGGNRLHGQARLIRLAPSLAARDFFDRWGKPENSNTILGGQISGPVLLPHLYDGRNRTFFMFDIESRRSRQGSTSSVAGLTKAQWLGDLSGFPEEFWPVDPLTKEGFPGGRIPPDRVVPQARYYIDNFVRLADDVTGELTFENVSNNSALQFTTRIDHQFSPASTLSVSVFYHDGYFNSPWGVHGPRFEVDDPSKTVALHYTHVFSPASINSLSFGLSEGFRDQSIFGAADDAHPEDLGFNITRTSDGAWGLPTAIIAGLGWLQAGRSQSQWQSETWNLKDSLSLLKGNHSMKMGVDIRRLRERSIWGLFGGDPAFHFDFFIPHGTGISVSDFVLGIPGSYRQEDVNWTRPRRNLSSFFFQDHVRLRPNLTLNLGLRYDLYGSWKLASGRNAAFRKGAQSDVFPEAPRGMLFAGDLDPATGQRITESLTPSDRTNFAPRVGLAFSPETREGFAGKFFGGPGRTSLRAGYGIYTIQNDSGWFKGAGSVFPWGLDVFRTAEEIADARGSFADPWGADPDPFAVPRTEQLFPERSRVPLVDPRLRDPYQHQWSISWQRELGSGILVETAYVGSAGRNRLRSFQANQALLTEDADLSNVEARREFQQFTRFTGYIGDGKSSYHGLQLLGSRRFSSGLQFNLNYTWSKTLDDGFDRDVDTWARANIDQRHRFAGTLLWEIPGAVGNRILSYAVEDWRVTGIIRLATGSPLNFLNPIDSTLRGIRPGRPDIAGPFTRFDPREVRTFQMPDGRTVTGNFFFDPTFIRAVEPENVDQARPGNLGRNVFVGPGVNNVDLSLGKRFPITESQQLDFRVDVSNFFKHTQFSTPAIQWTGDQGRINRTYGARKIQLYLRYQF